MDLLPLSPPLPNLRVFSIRVLLIDDQEMIAHAVRRLLSHEPDIELYYCADPTKAISQVMSVAPTVILLDLIMPQMDGIELISCLHANPQMRDIPLIVLSSKEDPVVKAKAFSAGANDYIVKLPDQLELIARIRHHSNGYIRLLERNDAYERLLESQRLLTEELAHAAHYVRSLMPPQMEGPVTAKWLYIPSAQLSGDAIGYEWLDAHHLAIYLLDACGHGVGAALLAISAIHLLRSREQLRADFYQPISVFQALNASFSSECQDSMFLSLWYGVYDCLNRNLIYGSAGHPPALLIEPGQAVKLLATDGIAIGVIKEPSFSQASLTVPKDSQLFLFSDGAYEWTGLEGKPFSLEQWVQWLSEASHEPKSAIEQITARVSVSKDVNSPCDDYSLLQLIFL